MNKSKPYEERICKRFGWHDVSKTLNGHTWVEVRDEDYSSFVDTVRQRYLAIIKDLTQKA